MDRKAWRDHSQGSANSDQWAKCGSLLFFVNKVLLARGRACFPATMAELSSWDREHMTRKA